MKSRTSVGGSDSLILLQYISSSTVQDKNPADENGWTPLHIAAEQGHHDICQIIIENVETKNPTDENGDTPLKIAIENEHSTIIRLIKEQLGDTT